MNYALRNQVWGWSLLYRYITRQNRFKLHFFMYKDFEELRERDENTFNVNETGID